MAYLVIYIYNGSSILWVVPQIGWFIHLYIYIYNYRYLDLWWNLTLDIYDIIYINMTLDILTLWNMTLIYVHISSKMDDLTLDTSSIYPRLRRIAAIPADGTSQLCQVQVVVQEADVGDLGAGREFSPWDFFGEAMRMSLAKICDRFPADWTKMNLKTKLVKSEIYFGVKHVPLVKIGEIYGKYSLEKWFLQICQALQHWHNGNI